MVRIVFPCVGIGIFLGMSVKCVRERSKCCGGTRKVIDTACGGGGRGLLWVHRFGRVGRSGVLLKVWVLRRFFEKFVVAQCGLWVVRRLGCM